MGTISEWTSNSNKLKNRAVIITKSNSLATGSAAELLACAYLEKQGMQLITRNFRCRLGEIDLIMQHEKELVFVEVRYRQSNDFGGARDSIDRRKQQKIAKTASYYLLQHSLFDDTACRFDVMIVNSVESKRIEWIQDAFRLDD